MWTSRLFQKKKEVPLQDINNLPLPTTATIKSPFDIVQQQRERNNLVENGAPHIAPTASTAASGPNSSNFRISFLNTQTKEGEGVVQQLEVAPTLNSPPWGEELLELQMGKIKRGKRGSMTRKWLSMKRRPSLKRQPEYALGANLQSSSSGDQNQTQTVDTTDDSIIILSPADSQSVTTDQSHSSVGGLDSGGGHYRSGAKPKTDNVQRGPKRTRLFNSPSTSTSTSTSARSSNDTIDLVDVDDDDDDPDYKPTLFVNPQHRAVEPLSNDVVVVLSDEDSKGELQESSVSTTSMSTVVVSDTTTENDCEIIAVKVVATNKQSPSSRAARRKSPGNGFLGNGRNSLSYNSVKLSVDRAKRRVSSSNLAKPSVLSHGIRKKKNKGKKGKGKGGQGPSSGVRNNTRTEFEFVTPISLRKNSKTRPQRRATSPVFLLDRELGPSSNPNFGSRFSQLPSTSWGAGAPTFIPVGGTGGRRPFNFGLRQPSQSQPQQPVIPAEPNFLSVSTNENRVPGSLRPIVVDGSNVAMGHKGNKTFSCRGIQICVEFFKRRGHEVVACVPQFRKKQSESVDTDILETMEKEGTVKFTPSREVGGQRIASYDDRFIVQYAHMKDAVIISNDNFKDIYNEEPEWRDTLRFRILQFTWMDENCIMFPRDPMGRNGPDLEEFLRF